MKRIKIISKVSLACLLINAEVSAQKKNEKSSNNSSGEFSNRFFSNRYIEGVGFVLYGNNGLFGSPSEVLSNAQQGVGGWNPRLGYCESKDCVVLTMRMQDNYDSFSKDSSAAQFSYTNNRASGDESVKFAGAVIFDLYTPGVGGLFEYDPKRYGFHFKFAAQLEYDDLDLASSVDTRTYFLGASILAPTLNKNWRMSPALASTMDFGYKYTENRITGESQSSLAVRWKPAFRKLLGRNISFKELRQPNAFKRLLEPVRDIKTLKNSTGKQASLNPGASSLTSEKNKHVNGTFEGREYFYIQPNIDFEQLLSVARGREEGLCACGGLEIGASVFEGHLTLAYKGDVVHDIANGDTFFHHAFTANVFPFKNSITSISFSYEKGEVAPDFINEDLFKAGIGIKF